MADSRTSKTLRNVRVAFAFCIFGLVANFFSRKVFIDVLGAELLGLNTTAGNLLGFLNLAELGISGAVAALLYRPIFENDRETISEIISIQGWFYRIVSVCVCLGAAVLLPFFPLIFAKAQVPLIYAYLTFGVLLANSLLGYLFNYKQVLLTADQKDYKVILNLNGFRLLKIVLQIAAIALLPKPYLWWLALEVVLGVVSVFVLSRVIRREYPWLKSNVASGGKLRRKHPEILRKTGQVFFHKIGGFALFQASPLVIYAFTDMTTVAVYGSYLMCFAGIGAIFNSAFNGVTAGIGNLISEGNSARVNAVYWEFTSVRYWLASIIVFACSRLATPFVALWIGKDNVLDDVSFALLLAYYFIQFTRTTDTFLSAFGLFRDVWAPVAEAAINLCCSIAFGFFWGLPGVLAGILLSQLVIIVVWKPYFLFRDGLRTPFIVYLANRGMLFAMCIVSAGTAYFTMNAVFETPTNTWVAWIFSAMKISGVYVLVSIVVFFVAIPAFRRATNRLATMLIPRFLRAFR